MKILFSLAIALFTFFNVSAQITNALDVADITLKVGAKSEETLYYGFAEGDQILFSFKEIDGNAVKEVEIIALPESSKFKDYEVKEVNNKIISVYKKGIYQFRFYNSALLKGRVCSIKIKRIPKNPTLANFNTAVKWVEKLDTTYELKTATVYNSTDNQGIRKKLVRIDTNVVSVIDRTERVSSMSKLGDSNVQYISVKLPQNTYYPDATNPYQKTEVASWAYAITVGGTGAAWYKSANEKVSGKMVASVAKLAAGTAVKTGLVSTGYGALAVLAIEGVSAFSNPPQGDNIKFGVLATINNQSIFLDSGNSVAASGRVTQYTQGEYTIKLENDNYIEGINVDVKVIAVTVTQVFENESFTVKSDAPLKERKEVKVPKVKVVKVPVFVD